MKHEKKPKGNGPQYQNLLEDAQIVSDQFVRVKYKNDGLIKMNEGKLFKKKVSINIKDNINLEGKPQTSIFNVMNSNKTTEPSFDLKLESM